MFQTKSVYLCDTHALGYVLLFLYDELFFGKKKNFNRGFRVM